MSTGEYPDAGAAAAMYAKEYHNGQERIKELEQQLAEARKELEQEKTRNKIFVDDIRGFQSDNEELQKQLDAANAQAAVMRKFIESEYRQQIQTNYAAMINETKDALKTCLDGTAGREMLERCKAMEEALREIADYSVGGSGICAGRGCNSPEIAMKALQALNGRRG